MKYEYNSKRLQGPKSSQRQGLWVNIKYQSLCLNNEKWECHTGKTPHTHVSLILESEVTSRSAAMKVSSSLAVEVTAGSTTVLRGPEPLKSFHYNSWCLSMVIGMHLYIWGADIHFVTASLHTDNMTVRAYYVGLYMTDWCIPDGRLAAPLREEWTAVE